MDAAGFIKSFGNVLRPGEDTFIVAIDGRDHSSSIVRAAYNDKAGTNAAFALNLLSSINNFCELFLGRTKCVFAFPVL